MTHQAKYLHMENLLPTNSVCLVLSSRGKEKKTHKDQATSFFTLSKTKRLTNL